MSIKSPQEWHNINHWITARDMPNNSTICPVLLSSPSPHQMRRQYPDDRPRFQRSPRRHPARRRLKGPVHHLQWVVQDCCLGVALAGGPCEMWASVHKTIFTRGPVGLQNNGTAMVQGAGSPSDPEHAQPLSESEMMPLSSSESITMSLPESSGVL